MDSDSALGVHIRNLLLDYALTHLTEDYIEFTEQAVSNLLSGHLRPISLTDPQSLCLPEDPFDTLSRSYGLASLEPYDEKWTADAESLQYIKNNLLLTGKLKTERCWEDEDDFNYEKSMYRPMSPVLTLRATRQTPKPGTKTQPHCSLAAFLASHSITSVAVAAVQDAPAIKLEVALNLRLSVDAQTHAAVTKLLASTAALARPRAQYANPHTAAFLRCDSPPLSYEWPDSPFIALTRACPPCSSSRRAIQLPSGLDSISDLPSMIANVKTEADEPDPLSAVLTPHAADTYRTSTPPSPSTPSSTSGHRDALDALFLVSSPNTEPTLIQVLLDEAEMLRTTKISGTRSKPAPLGAGEGLVSFLLPRIPTLQPAFAPAVAPQSPLSVAGEASLNAGGYDKRPEAEWEAENGLDAVIAGVCKEFGGQDAAEPILREKLEERDGLLMTVPALAPPTSPTSGMFLPTSVHDLIAPAKLPKDKENTTTPAHPGILKNAKGIPSLNMELSWMFGPRAPMHEEVAGVCGGSVVGDVEPAGASGRLIEQAGVVGDEDEGSFRGKDPWVHLDDTEDGKEERRRANDDCEMVLTRYERRWLAGLPEVMESSDRSSDHEGEEPADPDGQRPAKRPRQVWQPHGFDDSSIALGALAPEGCLPDLNLSRINDGYAWLLDDDEESVPPVVRGSSEDEYHVEFGRYTIDRSYGVQQDSLDGCVQLGLAVSGHEPDQEHQEFLPLTFDTLQALPSQPLRAIRFQENLALPNVPAAIVTDETDAYRPSIEFFDPSSPTSTVPPLGIASFMHLRRKNDAELEPRPAQVPASLPVAPDHAAEPFVPHAVPAEIFDPNTLRTPSPWPPPSTRHRYMASMDILQKQALIRALRAPYCAVDIVERDTLDGVDLILDPHSAVIFVPLVMLPSQCEALTRRLGEQSWRYVRLLVVFEAFPTSQAMLNPFSPPVLKAVKRLRRDLGIAEGRGEKRESMDVWFAFSGTVEEAAVFVRVFGDFVERCDDTERVLWDGERAWLDGEAQEGEHDMAAVDGMNVFVAAVILCQMPLQDFLDLPADARLCRFGTLVGGARIVMLNDVIARRMEAMETGC